MNNENMNNANLGNENNGTQKPKKEKKERVPVKDRIVKFTYEHPKVVGAVAVGINVAKFAAKVAAATVLAIGVADATGGLHLTIHDQDDDEDDNSENIIDVSESALPFEQEAEVEVDQESAEE